MVDSVPTRTQSIWNLACVLNALFISAVRNQHNLQHDDSEKRIRAAFRINTTDDDAKNSMRLRYGRSLRVLWTKIVTTSNRHPS